ncbi:MAG: putative motility protein [Pseudomonadota bacterium]
MNIDMNASSAIAQQMSQTSGDQVALAVLKKSMNAEAQAALALIQAIPQPTPAANLPPHLGQNINVTA